MYQIDLRRLPRESYWNSAAAPLWSDRVPPRLLAGHARLGL